MSRLPVLIILFLSACFQGSSQWYPGMNINAGKGINTKFFGREAGSGLQQLKMRNVLFPIWSRSNRRAAESIYNDSIVKASSHSAILQKSILPLSLISLALILNKSQYERDIQKDIHIFAGDDFSSKADDYLQYAPVAQLYLGDLAGIKARNHWFDQSKYLLLSNILSAVITHGIKNVYSKSRPGGSPHSFPSGHTSLAFVNATVLYHEYNTTSPLIAYSGFAFATATGVLRILNNKHWLSDVLAGAGTGIFSAHLVYVYQPFKNFNPFLKNKGNSTTMFLPYYNNGAYGMVLISAF